MRRYNFIIGVEAQSKISKKELNDFCEQLKPHFINGKVKVDWRQMFRVWVDAVLYYIEAKNKTEVRKKALGVFGSKRKILIVDNLPENQETIKKKRRQNASF